MGEAEAGESAWAQLVKTSRRQREDRRGERERESGTRRAAAPTRSNRQPRVEWRRGRAEAQRITFQHGEPLDPQCKTSLQLTHHARCHSRNSKRESCVDPWEERSAGLHEDSPIVRIFGGFLQSAVRSKCAKADSVSLEPFNHLDLDISQPSVKCVKTALDAFFSPETVNEGQAMRRLQFKALPKVLILSLKRFTYNRAKGGPQKVQKTIKYEQRLAFDRSWFADADGPPPEYCINAIICHHGDREDFKGRSRAFGCFLLQT